MKQTISTGSFLRKKKILKHAPALKPIWEKKGYNVVAVDISGQFSYSDFIIICSASSTKHAQTIADAVQDEVKKKKALAGIEGYNPGDWILLDAGGMIIHVFTEETRAIYNIEGLWYDVPVYHIVEEPGK